MRFQGKITKWFDDKGYGFITSDQGENVFLHFSAFKSTGLRANVGDRVSYKIAKGDKGLQAYDLEFLDKVKTSNRLGKRSSKSTLTSKIFFVLVAAVIGLSLTQFRPERIPPAPVIYSPSEEFIDAPRTMNFQCMGKTRCTEMVSCDEAVFYLENCPGTISDGDGDGIPCEDQWCGH
jgi:cold shock CspA family protein